MTNYFELLHLQPVFNLDLSALEAAYFKAQRAFHPDRFVGKPEAERVKAIQQSVEVNRAYQALKSPLTRAQHVLLLNGIIVGTDRDSVKPSQALLTEIMELREDLPEAKALAEMTDHSITRIRDYYAAGDWQAMAQETLRLSYLMKTQEDAR